MSKKWLRLNLFNKKNNFKKNYKSFFETTQKKKLNKIKLLKITHFIDDLDEILNKLPSNINKIKFNSLFKFTSIKKNMTFSKLKMISKIKEGRNNKVYLCKRKK